MKNGRLPTFLIVGAKRSGTTSLANWIAGHPQAFLAKGKELHFFNRNLDRGPEWYKQHFAAAPPQAIAIGEATQTYMFDPEVPPRIAALMPDAKLIAILRNPIDRAYSDYWWRRLRGLEELGFEEAIEAEQHRARQSKEGFLTSSYLERGRYHQQLKYLAGYFARNQIHVLLTEDLGANSHRIYRDLCSFLNIDDALMPTQTVRKTNSAVPFRSLRVRKLTHQLPPPMDKLVGRLNQRRKSGYPKMNPDTRERLVDYFRDDNTNLSAWLGRDLNHWNR